MRFIRSISRILFGLVFISSGLLKLIDPVGTGLQVTEYLHILHLSFFSSLSVLLGIALSVTEFVIGVSVLTSTKMRIVSYGALAMMIFFTPLTLYLALFNPITDCGCFGEAFRPTNWETFLKNVVLIGLAIIIFINRNRYIPIANRYNEWIMIGVYGVIALEIALFSYRHIPIVDFSEFKPGADLSLYLEENRVLPQYKTTYIYEKGGERISIDIEVDDLPDSTWLYIDAESEIVSEGDGLQMDFKARDAEGNYVTREILGYRSLFISVFTDMSKISDKTWERVSLFADSVRIHGADMIILAASYPQEADQYLSEYGLTVPIYYGDYKTLITLIRSNGGVIYLQDGYIVQKWGFRDLPYNGIDRIINDRDYDLTITKVLINGRLKFQILIFSLILIAVVLRYLMKSSKSYKLRELMFGRALSIKKVRLKRKGTD